MIRHKYFFHIVAIIVILTATIIVQIYQTVGKGYSSSERNNVYNIHKGLREAALGTK